MKQQPFGNFTRLLHPVLIFCVFLFVTACKPPAGGAIKFASLKYTSGQVTHWLDSAKTNNFVFQFYTPAAESEKRPYQLISYIIDTAGNYLNAASPDTLSLAKDSLTTLNGKAILGNSYISKKTILNMLKDSGGKKRDFDYLLLTPIILPANQHVVYQVQIIKGEVVLKCGTGDVNSNPSPPATMQ